MNISENVNISHLTTFKIGGRVKYLFQPQSIDECLEALRIINNRKLPYFVLGEGSNVLIGSRDYEGAVLSMLGIDHIDLSGSDIKAGSGVINTNLSQYAYDKSIEGFEFMYRMPGSIGGSTLMNARCFGSSMSDIIVEVKTVNKSLDVQSFCVDEIGFGYKKSLFQDRDHIILEVTFKAEKGNPKDIEEKMRSNEENRLSTRQYDYPSAGCIFKNNYALGVASGKIIDELGLKGEKIGDAEIYEYHGNFIINNGQASSEDVLQLIQLIQKKAKADKQIDLECEVQFHGQF